MVGYPNDQGNPAGAIPVRVTNGSGGGGGPPASATPKGFQQIAAATLATATTLTVPAGATSAVVQAETGDVRWRDDAVAPTGTVGVILYGGGQSMYLSGSMTAIQFIASSGAAPILNVSYYA